jgi:outer membrane protein assembly factor BamD (BamD/ComL family)
MVPMNRHVKSVLLVVLPCALLWACSTQPATLPEGLPAAEIFQRAQDVSDKGDYLTAITWYSEVQKRYPADIEHGIWAQYEVAFLYHKSGRNELALTLVDALLDRYTKEGDALPPAPRVLAQGLKTRLEALLPKKQ